MSASIINAGAYTKPCSIKLSQIYCRVQLHAHTGVCLQQHKAVICMYIKISAAAGLM